MAPVPSHALDPWGPFGDTRFHTVGACELEVVNTYMEVAGPDNDTYQAGILVRNTGVSSPPSYIRGRFYSGQSHRWAISVPTFSDITSCNTNDSRFSSFSASICSIGAYSSCGRIDFDARELRSDGATRQHTIELVDAVPNGAGTPQDRDAPGMWQGTTTTIGATTLYHHPVANAGPDQTVSHGATVILDGSGTYDLDGDLATVAWVQTSGPTVTLDTSDPNRPIFLTPDLPTAFTMTFVMTPRDSAGRTPHSGFDYAATADAEVTVSVLDVTNPTLEILGLPNTIDDTTPFTVEFSFSEPVTGFDASDISISGASLSDFSGSDARYYATVTPTIASGIEISVPDGAAIDAVGLPLVGVRTQTSFDPVPQTQAYIENALKRRTTNLLANQPDLLFRFAGRNRLNGFNLTATEKRLDFNLSYSDLAGVWVQLRGSKSKFPNAESEYWFGVLGGERAISENMHLGVMIEFDRFSDREGDAASSGTGWLVGPYFVAKYPGRTLHFDGRLLVGRSENKISPFGTYTNTFSTDRLLATARATGEMETTLWLVFPFLSFQHVSDWQHAYRDGLGVEIPRQSVGITELEFGFDWTYRPILHGWELSGGYSGVYSNETSDVIASDFRSRMDLRFVRNSSDQSELSLSIHADGIGASGFESYGAGVRYQIEF